MLLFSMIKSQVNTENIIRYSANFSPEIHDYGLLDTVNHNTTIALKDEALEEIQQEQ